MGRHDPTAVTVSELRAFDIEPRAKDSVPHRDANSAT
jgi:hypothetical protein